MEKKWAPTGSLLVSDTWDTGIGRIGVLADLSYSRLYSRSDGISVTNYQTRDDMSAIQANSSTVSQCRDPLPGNTDTTRLPPANSPCGTASTAGADGFADPRALAYTPLGGQFRTQDYDRKRKGIELAAQWESNDRRALLSAQFLRSDSTTDWGEHTDESAPDLSEYDTYPAGCQQNGNGPGALPAGSNPTTTTRAECPVGKFTNYVYDADNVFESGFITMPGAGWRSADANTTTTRVPTGGMQQSLSRRQVSDENIVDDYGLNFKFNPDDHWQINLDAQYVQAQHDTLDVSVFGSNFADQELDLTGDLPILVNHKPLTLAATWATHRQAVDLLARGDGPHRAQHRRGSRAQGRFRL
ncbi:MAG: hypothetical protein WDN44_13110 [Sphingomonas sp.]